MNGAVVRINSPDAIERTNVGLWTIGSIEAPHNTVHLVLGGLGDMVCAIGHN